MALVQHERHTGVLAEPAAADHLVHDPEQLERIRRTHNQVIIRVEARVEVEGAQLAQAQQLHHNELDVGARGVVAGVEADVRLLPQRQGLGVGRAPVRNVGVVKSRLEELVLQHQPLGMAQAGVDLLQGLGQAVLPAAHVVLARVVRAVRQPDLQVPRAGGVHDVDAFEVVVDRTATDRFVRGRQGTELVLVILEGVRVDGAQAHAQACRILAQCGVVIHLVPRNMQRNGGRQARQFVDFGGVRDLLLHGPGSARRAEHLEARTRISIGPRRDLDGKLLEPAQRRCYVIHDGSFQCLVLLRYLGRVLRPRCWSLGDSARGGLRRRKLIVKIEDFLEDLEPFIGCPVRVFRVIKKSGHFRLPAGVDFGERHPRPDGVEVVAFHVAHQQAVRAQEERVVVPACILQRTEHLRPDGGVPAPVLIDQSGLD
ncbi:hypothetical protein D9M72_289300 [compost metagenome]